MPFTDTAVAGFEGGAAAKAFASLPERWQMVLWHLEVENQKPADIAPLLGMSANSVSALAYRAREGLRQAFLNMHSGDLVSDACRETNELLGGYVRGALSRRDAAKVEDHLEHCRRCTAVYLELTEVNSSLAALLGPALLGAAAAAYLGGGAAGSRRSGPASLVLLGRGKDVVLANLPASAATAAAVGVAGITAIAVVNRGPEREAGRGGAARCRRRAALDRRRPRTRTPGSDPGRRRSGRAHRAERGTGTGAGSDPVTGALGVVGADAGDGSCWTARATSWRTATGRAGRRRPGPGGTDRHGNGPGPGTGNGDGDGPGPDTERPEPDRRPDPQAHDPSRPTRPTDTHRRPPRPPTEPRPADVPSVDVAGQASGAAGRGHGSRLQVTGVPARARASARDRDRQHRGLPRPRSCGCHAVGQRLRLHRHPLAQPVRLRRQRERAGPR